MKIHHPFCRCHSAKRAVVGSESSQVTSDVTCVFSADIVLSTVAFAMVLPRVSGALWRRNACRLDGAFMRCYRANKALEDVDTYLLLAIRQRDSTFGTLLIFGMMDREFKKHK